MDMDTKMQQFDEDIEKIIELLDEKAYFRARDEILKYNDAFVANKGYEQFKTDEKRPAKKLAVVACMDTRLTELLPAATGLKNGDMKLIKNAGGTITNPFDSTIRSLLIGVYELGVDTIMIIGHSDCGTQHMDGAEMINHMRSHGISEDHIDMMKYCGIDLNAWLSGFADVETAISESVELVKNHPLMPHDIKVYGFIINSITGKLTKVK